MRPSSFRFGRIEGRANIVPELPVRRGGEGRKVPFGISREGRPAGFPTRCEGIWEEIDVGYSYKCHVWRLLIYLKAEYYKNFMDKRCASSRSAVEYKNKKILSLPEIRYALPPIPLRRAGFAEVPRDR